MKRKYAVDSSFSGTKEHSDHNKESRRRGYGRRRGGRGGRDNISQTHENANP